MNSAASETSPTDSAVAMNAGIERLKDDGKHDTDVATEVVTLASKDAGPPEQPAYSPLRKSLAIAGLTISLMLVALDATLVTTAVPTMAKELGGFDTYSWIGSGYMLTSTALGPLWGKIADIFGRKAVMQMGCLVFILFSVMCALAPSMTILIIARALKGIGGGCVQSLVFVLVAEVVSMQERAKYQGLMMAIVGLGVVAGPVIGGTVSEKASWRWCFWINLPIVSISMGLQQFAIIPTGTPSSMRSKLARIDWGGSLLCIAGSVLILLGFTFSESGWGSEKTIACLILGPIVLGLFVLWEIKFATEPAVPMRLFADRGFLFAALATFCAGWIMFGNSYGLPLFYQLARQASPLASSLMFLPFGVSMFFGSLLVGAISSRTGRYLELPRVGFFMMAVVMAICTAFWSYDVHIAVIYVTSGAMGLFFGIGFTMITVVVQVNAQLKDLGPATAVAQFIRSLGSTVSIAVFAAILNTAMPTIFASYLPSLGKLGISPSAAKAYVDSVTSGAPMPNLNAQQLAAISEATARSFAQALRWCFLAILPACLLAFIFLMFVPFKPLQAQKPKPIEAPKDEEVNVMDDISKKKEDV